MDRKEFFKRMGLIMAGAVALDIDAKANTMMALSEGEIPDIAAEKKINVPIASLDAKLSKPVTVAVIGAGSRGTTYSRYAEKFPNSMKVVAVADLNAHRRGRLASKHKIAKENIFSHFNKIIIIAF